MKKLILLLFGFTFAIVVNGQSTGVPSKNQREETTLKEKIPFDSAPKVYPNPASNEITIEFGQNFEKGHLKLYTINGSEILQQGITSMEKLDISHLRDGFYFYE